jgi:non-specific serine/threonine protein kinase
LTGLVGREKATDELRACLASARLVTLTGPGGVGKTRLAIQVADALAAEFRDGVWFVDLAALADPALVPQAVAVVLGVEETPDAPLSETLCHVVGGKQMLLVWDNCEHLVEACARLALTLLQYSPRLRLLATSREALGITGETVWRVPALSLPDERPTTSDQRPTLEQLTEAEAVRLFVDRAVLGQPHFVLTEQNAAQVAQVCRQLDGLPLSIELAAAWLKVLTVEQLAERLNDRFGLLTRGPRTAAPRQQTLRATMDWSYALLSEPERTLLRRLAVFTGIFTLAAAEVVCGEGCRVEPDSSASTLHPLPYTLHPDDVLDLLSALVEKSLVAVEETGEAACYRLLETTRAYAWEQLSASGEVESVRERHAEYFLDMAERARPMLRGPHQAAWSHLLEAAHDHLRAALEWWTREDAGEAAAEKSLRMVGALGPFWWLRGYRTEGLRWVEKTLAGSAAPTAARAAALHAGGHLAVEMERGDCARRLLEESRELYRRLGDRAGLALVANTLGNVAVVAGDRATARARFEEALALSGEIGDPWSRARALNSLGKLTQTEGDLTTARAILQECLALQRGIENPLGVAAALNNLGLLSQVQGDLAAARRFHSECLAIDRELGHKPGIAWCHTNLAVTSWSEGDLDAAHRWLARGVTLLLEVGQETAAAHHLRELARLTRERDAGPRGAGQAARLLGAASAIPRGGAPGRTAEPPAEPALRAAWEEGRTTPLEQLLAPIVEPAATD